MFVEQLVEDKALLNKIATCGYERPDMKEGTIPENSINFDNIVMMTLLQQYHGFMKFSHSSSLIVRHVIVYLFVFL